MESDEWNKKVKRIQELAKTESYLWTAEQNAEYLQLARETGVSLGLDGKLYGR